MTTSTYGGSVDQTAVIGHAPESRDWHPGDPAHPPLLGVGVRVEAYVTIDSGLWNNTSIGAGTWLMKGCHVGHDVFIGERCELSPHCVIGGHAEIGDDVRLGIGALVRPFVKIGAKSRIGMGAVVVEDVPPNTLVYGNPARPHPWKGNAGPDYGSDIDPRVAAGHSREFGRAITRLADSDADLRNHVRKLKQGG